MERVPDEFERGERQSDADIAAGCPRLFWQTRGAWGELLMRLMFDRFEVAVQHISDMTSAAQSSYHAGYNGKTIAHINDVFGEGAFQSIVDEVERYRELQTQRYLESKQQTP